MDKRKLGLSNEVVRRTGPFKQGHEKEVQVRLLSVPCEAQLSLLRLAGVRSGDAVPNQPLSWERRDSGLFASWASRLFPLSRLDPSNVSAGVPRDVACP